MQNLPLTDVHFRGWGTSGFFLFGPVRSRLQLRHENGDSSAEGLRAPERLLVKFREPSALRISSLSIRPYTIILIDII